MGLALRWMGENPLPARLSLPHVTLMMFDTRDHALARLSLLDSTSLVDFGETVIFTDRPSAFDGIPARIITVPDFPTIADVSRFAWYGIAPHIRTSHFYHSQYDSWVIDPGMWRDEFLGCDYIGAPWWYKDGRNVGCGASLRSVRLMNLLIDRQADFPHKDPEDDVLGREYRPGLEKLGIRWASEDLAYDFSYERTEGKGLRHFCFHGIFNWPNVLSPYRLRERYTLAAASPRIAGKTEFGELTKTMLRMGIRPPGWS